MPDFSFAHPRPAVLLRGALIVGLVLALFFIGIFSDAVLAAIDAFWQHLLRLLGLADQAATLQQGISGLVTKRSLISVVTYSLLYTCGCLLLLIVALNDGRRFRLVLQLYAAVFAACFALVVVGKLAGDATWAYKLARRLIDFIVSLLPVIILVPLLSWYRPTEKKR
jgi:small-conductance mechanosensitive channel